MFKTCFQWIFLSNKWVDSFFHSHLNLSFYLGCAKTHFLLVWIQEEAEIELGVDSKCAPKGEAENEGTSQVFREGLVGLS